MSADPLAAIDAILKRFPGAELTAIRQREAPAGARSVTERPTLQELWEFVLGELATHSACAAAFPNPVNTRRLLCSEAILRLVRQCTENQTIMAELQRIRRRELEAQQPAEGDQGQ